MKLVAHVVAADGATPPPAGTRVHVEVRDVTVQDAASVLVASAEGAVVAGEPGLFATVTVDVAEPLPHGRDLVLWARVAVSGTDRTTAGDWITTESIPLPISAIKPLQVPVHQIG